MVRVLTGIASDLYYTDHEREGRVAHEALAIAEELDDAETLAAAQMSVHLWYTHRPEASRRTALACDAPRSRVALPENEYACGSDPSLVHFRRPARERQEITSCETSLDGPTSISALAQQPQDIYWSMALRATQATLHGDLAAGEQLARGAALRGHELEQLSDGAYLLQRFVVRYEQGRLRKRFEVWYRPAQPPSVFRRCLARRRLRRDQPTDRAVAITLRILEPDGTDLPWRRLLSSGIAFFAGSRCSGRIATSSTWCEMLEPCADHVVVFGAGGAVLGAGHHWLRVLAAACGDTDTCADLNSKKQRRSRRSSRLPTGSHKAGSKPACCSREVARHDIPRAASFIAEATAIAEPGGYGRALCTARSRCADGNERRMSLSRATPAFFSTTAGTPASRHAP